MHIAYELRQSETKRQVQNFRYRGKETEGQREGQRTETMEGGKGREKE